jgi:hypothetical protein
MGVVLPVIMIAASTVAASAAVYTAVTVMTVTAIALAAVSVAATAASVVYAVQGDMKNAMLFAGIGIAGGVATVYIAAQGAIAHASALMAQGMAEAQAAYAGLEASFAVQATAYITSIQSSFGSFLEAIHFKVVLAAHQIVYLVSAEYRSMMSTVFGQIQQVSTALGLGANDLNLILRDARNTVLDTSAMMGHGYDMGELTYWATMQDFFKDMSGKMDVYKYNPGKLLFDLDQKIFRPAADTKADTQSMVYSTLDNMVRVAETTTHDLFRVRNDLASFASHLPEDIRKEIAPAIKLVTDSVDDFIKSIYTPTMIGVQTYINNLRVDHDTQALRLSDLIERARRPSTLLRPMEDLDLDEMYAEEEFIANKIGRSMVRQLDSFEVDAAPDRAETQDILDAIPTLEEMIPEAFMGGEVPEIGLPPPVVPRDKWDVGDF